MVYARCDSHKRVADDTPEGAAISSRVAAHLRANVVGWIALFFALSGFAHALGTGSVRSRHIQNDQVRSADVRNDDLNGGGLGAADLAADSVGDGEIRANAVRSSELGPDSVDGSKIPNNAVGAGEIALGSVASVDLTDEQIQAEDIGPGEVGGSELGAVYTHPGTAVVVPGGTEGNGSYLVNTATSNCPGQDRILSGHGEWTTNGGVGDEELFISDTFVAVGTDGIQVTGANDTDTDHSIRAVAICLPD